MALDEAARLVHQARVIFRRTGVSKMGRLALITDEGAEPFPDGWHDEIVCHTIRRNNDGSITAVVLVNVYDGKNKRKWTAERTIRLEEDKPC